MIIWRAFIKSYFAEIRREKTKPHREFLINDKLLRETLV